MAKEQTRNLLLEVGLRVFLERGYTNSGLESILQAAQVPKGSFYHYFHSKEDFGLQVLDRFAQVYDEQMDLTFRDESLTPIARFRNYFEGVVDRFDRGHCRKGCLVGNLSQEMASQSEAFREKLEEIFLRWAARYEECLELAHAVGEIRPILSIGACVELWLSGWQGAMLRAKTMQSSRPLQSFLAIMMGQVLRVASAPPSRVGSEPACAAPASSLPSTDR